MPRSSTPGHLTRQRIAHLALVRQYEDLYSMTERWKWAVSVLAVLTVPIWALPVFVWFVFRDAVDSFKKTFLD